MSLLQPTKRYTRPQQLTEPTQPILHSTSLIEVLEDEAYNLLADLKLIEEAKSREDDLRLRLNVVQQSLAAFRALEAAPEPVQEDVVECFPIPQEKRVRKAATKKTTVRSIASEPIVSDTKNIDLANDDFATFPSPK